MGRQIGEYVVNNLMRRASQTRSLGCNEEVNARRRCAAMLDRGGCNDDAQRSFYWNNPVRP
jgi:hypothetical protein